MGVAEMTRFGMAAEDFGGVAELIKEVVAHGTDVSKQVTALRSRFRDLQYCFRGEEADALIQKLHALI
jgi:glycine/serine hydroxymethyltransferase